ncbi:UNVERIFIED_ORG: hypothetical protein DFS12_103474 [Chitinophaga ginsengisegetis]|nr:hypothetical protein [Chitinophaga ginsengisegetis]MDR6647467.1 hypothetical protein [Chitinophaga ginsengisegetis]MDR6653817.1 hypothetical protein [Chitinophaga ginsengisegetis]
MLIITKFVTQMFIPFLLLTSQKCHNCSVAAVGINRSLRLPEIGFFGWISFCDNTTVVPLCIILLAF